MPARSSIRGSSVTRLIASTTIFWRRAGTRGVDDRPHAKMLSSRLPPAMTDSVSQPRAALGFGCAALPIAHRRARSLLACAFEHGVRHFDVARKYGNGEAEKILGDFLRDKRD